MSSFLATLNIGIDTDNERHLHMAGYRFTFIDLGNINLMNKQLKYRSTEC